MNIISQDEHSMFAVVDGQLWKAICWAKFTDSRVPLFFKWHLRGDVLDMDCVGIEIQPVSFWTSLNFVHHAMN